MKNTSENPACNGKSRYINLGTVIDMPENTELLYIKKYYKKENADVLAIGYRATIKGVEKPGIIVCAGSYARKGVTPSAEKSNPYILKNRNRLIDEKAWKCATNKYQFYTMRFFMHCQELLPSSVVLLAAET